jgi:hypothetical protein
MRAILGTFGEPTRLGLRLFSHCAGLFSPESGFKLHARAYHGAAQLLRNAVTGEMKLYFKSPIFSAMGQASAALLADSLGLFCKVYVIAFRIPHDIFSGPEGVEFFYELRCLIELVAVCNVGEVAVSELLEYRIRQWRVLSLFFQSVKIGRFVECVCVERHNWMNIYWDFALGDGPEAAFFLGAES